MTNKEAIEMLIDWNKDLEVSGDEAEAIMCHLLAIKALENQVPKKLIKTEINNDDCCPSCKHPIRFIKEGYFDLDYCLYCGQKIDWGEEDTFFDECECKEIDNNADIMPLSEFIECVECGDFTDYDGYGELIIDEKTLADSYTDIKNEEFIIGCRCFLFSDILENYGERSKVAWYNR